MKAQKLEQNKTKKWNSNELAKNDANRSKQLKRPWQDRNNKQLRLKVIKVEITKKGSKSYTMHEEIQ